MRGLANPGVPETGFGCITLSFRYRPRPGQVPGRRPELGPVTHYRSATALIKTADARLARAAECQPEQRPRCPRPLPATPSSGCAATASSAPGLSRQLALPAPRLYSFLAPAHGESPICCGNDVKNYDSIRVRLTPDSHSTGLGGSRGPPSSACSSPGSRAAARCAG